MAVRQLTNKERRAARAAYKEFIAVAWVQDANPAKEGFEAGFAAGLDYQQARLDNQETALGSCREAFEHLEADNARLRDAHQELFRLVRDMTDHYRGTSWDIGKIRKLTEYIDNQT